MLESYFNGIKIEGISVAVPTKKENTSSFYKKFGKEAVQKFVKMTGVNGVFRAIPEQTASDLGYEAAIRLLDNLRVDLADIGLIIFVTQKPDYRSPSTSYVLHKRLGLNKDCSAFDVNLGCSGYVYGLNIIFSMMQNSSINKALLITGDTSIKTVSPEDRSAIMLFGDAGSATLVGRSDENNNTRMVMRTKGDGFKAIITPAGAYRNSDAPKERVLWADGNIRSDYDTYMNGTDVFNFTISEVPKLIKEFLKSLDKDHEDYDIFAFHQANLFILKQLSKKIKIPLEKIQISLDRFGNVSSNSIPLVLADAYGKVDMERQINVFMSGFGVGLSWGCVDISIDSKRILPIIYTDEYYIEGEVDNG